MSALSSCFLQPPKHRQVYDKPLGFCRSFANGGIRVCVLVWKKQGRLSFVSNHPRTGINSFVVECVAGPFQIRVSCSSRRPRHTTRTWRARRICARSSSRRTARPSPASRRTRCTTLPRRSRIAKSATGGSLPSCSKAPSSLRRNPHRPERPSRQPKQHPCRPRRLRPCRPPR